MCLHGALEGKDEENLIAREAHDADELPSQVEMRNRGYLAEKECVRQAADFRRNNMPAKFLRSNMKLIFSHTSGIVRELNDAIEREDPRSPVSGGGSWFLFYE